MTANPETSTAPAARTPPLADEPSSAVDLHALARGEVAAVEVFYRELFEAVYAFVFWRVGRVRQDAEDVTQETFVTALATIERFEGRSTLFTWVCGIARNLAFARMRGRHREVSGNEPAAAEIPGIDGEGAPDRLLERAQTVELVGRALTELPPHYQQALLEKYVQQRSFAEMAAQGGSTPKAVEGTVQRAKRALARALERLGLGGIDGESP